MIHIALLRGINVSGQKAIKMADLMNMCGSLGFGDPTTYLQSGNIVFEHEKADALKIADKISKAMLIKFGFEVKIMVRTADELELIVAGNPLLKKPGIDVDKLHVTFLSDSLKEQNPLEFEMSKAENEIFVIKNREIYLYCPNGYGKTKLNNQMFEKKLKISATTRNWKTVCAILEIVRKKKK